MQNPFQFSVFHFDRALNNSERSKFKSRTDFRQRDVLSTRQLFEGVVTERDEIIDVVERDQTRRVIARNGKKIAKNALDAQTERGGEVLEDEMRELLRHRADALDVVARDDVVDREGDRGAHGQMADRERVGNAA